jgi:hypothetical protein
VAEEHEGRWSGRRGVGAPRTAVATGDVHDLSVEVERRMMRGDRFSDVEDVIESSDLSAEEKSALWLLGWSYVDWRAQRREARAHVAAFGREQQSLSRPQQRRILRLVS